MTRKEWLAVIVIVFVMALLIFFGYKDYLRQQRLKQQTPTLSWELIEFNSWV